MVDVVAVAGALGAIKNAKDIAAGMLSLRDQQAIPSKVIELQGVILDAQERVLAATEERLAMLERVRALETQLADCSAWDAEKGRYELKSVSAGEGAVYALKATEAANEAPHWLCPNCFTRGQKSLLCAGQRQQGLRTWLCTPCKTSLSIYWECTPGNPL